MTEVKEMMNVPILQTRIRKNDDGYYLMSNQYIQSVATYLRNKYRKIKTIRQCEKSSCMQIRIYGFVYKAHFYLYLSKQFDADSCPKNIKKLGDIDNLHLQQISNVGLEISQLANKRAEEGKPAFPLISELKSAIVTNPRSTFDPNWQRKVKTYHVTDPNDPENDGRSTTDINEARSWCKNENMELENIQYITYDLCKNMGRIDKEIWMNTRNF